MNRRDELEKKVIDAALDLFLLTNAHAFKVQIPSTTPPLYLICGEAGQVKKYMESEHG